MRMQFLSKGSADQTSGGYLYNRYLVEHLRSAGVDVEYCASPWRCRAANQRTS